METLTDQLTDAQRAAVEHVDGPLLILAGPGSGKTRVITHRIAHLLGRGIPGRHVLGLTFTNKAAEEMKARVRQLTPQEGVWLGTFHRFCAQLLRKYGPMVGLEPNYTIYDTGDSLAALRRVLAHLGVAASAARPEAVAKAISWAKNNLIGPEQYTPQPGNPLGSLVREAYPAYQRRLAASNAADFDDLLLHVATLLRENPEVRRTLDERYRFVLVDEYQDTNLAQYAIVRALSVDHPNLAVTGDPDQSIYGWRGANLNNILEFERDFPEVRVVRLEQNYRSTRRILRVAGQLISHNVRRKEKGLFTENGRGRPVRLVTYPTHRDEAEAIAAEIAVAVRSGRRRARDFAVFYRVNALSPPFEFALREQGVPFQLVSGVEFFQRKEIKDVLGYLQLLNNPHDEVALLRVINTPARGIGRTTVERLADHATRHAVTLLEAARAARGVDALGKQARRKVERFVALYDRLVAVAGGPVEEVLGHVLSDTGYQEQLRESEADEDQERLANLEELLTIAREFDERHHGENYLEAFLEEASLVNDTDDWEEQADRVTLMTLHASKGLEFPAVYLVAVEEGLLPHERSRQRDPDLEEERRLAFVGITRAQEELQLSMARYRDYRGQRKMTVPSSFLMELPREEMELTDLAAGQHYDAEPPYVEPALLGTEVTGDIEADLAAHAPVEAEGGFPWETGPDDVPADAPAGGPAGGPAAPQGAPQPRSPLGVHLTTAAELADGGRPAPAVDPDAFRQDMLVRHPRYGLGHIVALSGSGPARKATVDFPPPAGRKKLVLAKSPLRPVKGQEDA